MIARKLKNEIILLSCLLFISISMFSQTIEGLYVNMPDKLNPTLSKQNRLELLEYYKAGQGDSVANRFGNFVYISIFDTIQQVVKVKNTSVSTFEMKLFRLEDNTPVVGIISTVCAKVCQSSLQFYDTAWNVVPLKFQMPKAVEWLKDDSLIQTNIDKEWIKNQLATSFISLDFTSDKNAIVAKNNTFQFLSEEDRKQVEPFVTDKSFVYNLKDRTWVKE